MPTKRQEMQSLIRIFKEETGEKEVDMHRVAMFAMKKGWPMPKPETALDRLAKQFSIAAREEVRRDPNTGRPYRVSTSTGAPLDALSRSGNTRPGSVALKLQAHESASSPSVMLKVGSRILPSTRRRLALLMIM